MAAKYEQLASILKSELQQLRQQGTARLATEAELSARYHMSRQTVRHALKLLEEEGLIQRRQGSGSYLSGSCARVPRRQIAIITTFPDAPLCPTIVHDAQTRFTEAGYSTLVFATENRVIREREILTGLLEQEISAVLVEGSRTALPTPNGHLFEQLRENGIPVLFLHGVYGNLPGFPCLGDDNFGGGRQLTQYLLSRGHRRFAGIFKSDDIQGPQRYHGVVTTLLNAGISIQDACFFWYDTDDRAALLQNPRCDLLQNFIRHRMGDATAVVCHNDEIAHLLIRKLLEQGLRVPEDISVACFDDSFYSRIGPVPITALGHKSSRPGRAAAAMVLELLDGRTPRPVCLEWELNCRSSA